MQQQDNVSVTQRLQQLRQETPNEYLQGAAPQQNNYMGQQQFEGLRQDNKFEDLMNQINKKNAERDTQNQFEYAQMSGGG